MTADQNGSESSNLALAHAVLNDWSHRGKTLRHYGVKGMKWGVRKDRKGRRRPTEQVVSEQKRNAKRSNTLQSNPKNRRLTNQEIKAKIDRINLENDLARLLTPPTNKKAPNQRSINNLLKDVAYDASRRAMTRVGEQVLTTALTTVYNRKAGADFKIPVKDLKKAMMDAVK